MNPRTLSVLGLAALCLLCSSRPVRAEPTEKAKKKQPSPFAGTYTGSWTGSTPGGDQEGAVTMTVDDDGNVTGESTNTTVNQTATIKGTILKDYKVAMVFEFANGQKYNGFGTFSRTSTGGFTGTLTQRLGTTAFGSIEYEVKPVKAK